MHGFSSRHTVTAALAWLDAQVRQLDTEQVSLRDAAGRVLASAIVSTVDVPGFDRATMDGYAVVADATEGASAYNRMPLRVLGDAMPGAPFGGIVGRGEAVRIMTGAPIPAGADSVLPAEFVETDVASGFPLAGTGSQTSGPAEAGHHIFAVASVSPQKNVGHRGEDITAGTPLLDAGRVLRPQDLGVISSIGIGRVSVVRRPRVRLVITGNELLPAGTAPAGTHITDANGPMLTALAERDGAIVDFPGLVRDQPEAIREALHAEADVVIVSGGSSVGIEDHAPLLLAQDGELAVHGIAMRPSSPTGFGTLGDRLVFLLPGNPVSALCAYDFFAGRAIRALGGRPKEWPYRSVRGVLTRKISSPIGRLDYARVRVVGRDPRSGPGVRPGADIEPLAVAGASILSSTTRADGFVIVGDDSEGYAAGAEVEVWLYA